MAGTVTPLRPPALRTSDTVRPRSGARLRSATALPPPPLSVVERMHAEHFPCGHKGCRRDGHVPSLVPFGTTTLVVLFCEPCIEELAPMGIRPVPAPKERR